jgi:hypothetical protein
MHYRRAVLGDRFTAISMVVTFAAFRLGSSGGGKWQISRTGSVRLPFQAPPRRHCTNNIFTRKLL